MRLKDIWPNILRIAQKLLVLMKGEGGSPGRYVLNNHFFIDSGPKITKFKIQFKTKSRILIQNKIHSIEIVSLKKMPTKLFKTSIAIPKANNCLLYETDISTFAKEILFTRGLGSLLGSYLYHSIYHVQAKNVCLKNN